jgi:hypothetical protein
MLIEPTIDRSFVAQVNRIAAGRLNVAFLLREPADQRRADHTAMSGDKYYVFR